VHICRHTRAHQFTCTCFIRTLACSYSSVPGRMNPYGNPSAPLESNNGIFLQKLNMIDGTHKFIRTCTHPKHKYTDTQSNGILTVIGDFGGEHSGEMVRHPNHCRRTRIRHLQSIPIAHKHRTHSQTCRIKPSHLKFTETVNSEQHDSSMLWMPMRNHFTSNSIEAQFFIQTTYNIVTYSVGR
jgi:hypothetical protein